MKGLTIRHENLYNKGEIPLQYELNVKRYAMKKLKNFVLITQLIAATFLHNCKACTSG
jgi:hypothetical protein